MTIGQKRKDRRRYSYDEGTDESAGLIDKESTDIETERPIDDAELVEQSRREGGHCTTDIRGMTLSSFLNWPLDLCSPDESWNGEHALMLKS
jgi:hypothetical protein